MADPVSPVDSPALDTAIEALRLTVYDEVNFTGAEAAVDIVKREVERLRADRDRLAAAPRYDREVLVETVIYHGRSSIEGCHCGWSVLGHSHAEHVADVDERALAVPAATEETE